MCKFLTRNYVFAINHAHHDPTILDCWSFQQDANPLKVVKLGSHTEGFSLSMTGDHHPQWPKGGFNFLLKTPGRVFTFIADAEHERQAWFRALFRACNPNTCQGMILAF